MWSTYGGKGARLVDPPNAVCWCSRWTSVNANQLARVGGVCTSGEVERVLQAMMSGQRRGGWCCTVARWRVEH